jgi:hypothetical protein
LFTSHGIDAHAREHDGSLIVAGKGIPVFALRRSNFGAQIPTPLSSDDSTMPKDLYRIVTRGSDGKLRIRDFEKPEQLHRMHTQVGIDDCSTDLGLRGQPVFSGLIGPMPEGKNIVRYESPDVFESLTKEWSQTKNTRRRRGHAPAGQEKLTHVQPNRESEE